ncbi:DNA polymerase III subunit gamma/tau [Herbaspirillum rhizosphaerae]|uniref:DNA polymerase III subunit gamma/tau n=1 Tax=Herbaspirillum rhizosphaerae TaxID=346179 RepID=UPI00067B6DC0|nr:DNA polymerase III subunit gamma/tau [Herbaspirillum rhizosphaerae]
MSYQVLARKYRPRSFDTLVGQEHVVRALTHALDQQRLHHAYLFTGTRGVGKTTLSRILAKSLNCVGADGNGGITAQPCGVCEACVAIDAGRFVDYIEMDAASNRGVDEMAQLLEQAIYAPSNARFKVYMIDEVHMLTNHAFNSMLKTLEEPPEHVKFILATTDPQKIPVTVLSRCLQFNLKQMPPGHIIGHLDNILGQENIEFEAPALRLLAQGAHGSMRDALSLTDQAIAYAAGKVTLEAVQGMLGALDQSYLIRVLDALAAQDGAALLSVADEMATRSLSYNAALQDLATLLHQIALAQTVPAALAEDAPQREDIVRLASQFNPEEAQLFYQIAVHGRNELGLAPDEYAGFSMTLLRMLAFRPVAANAAGSAGSAPAAPVARTAAPARPTPAAAPLSAAPQVATTSTPVSRPPAAAPAAAAGSANSARAAALEAARAGSGKSSPRSAAAATAAPAPAPAPVQAAPAPAPAPVLADVSDDMPPPWDEEPAGADAQKKTEQYSAAAANEAVSRVVPDNAQEAEDAIVVAPPAAVSTVTPAMQAQTAQVAASLGWDGNWPHLAAELPLRGMVQQMAQQSELVRCEQVGNAVCFHLRIPVETLRASGNVDKLTAVLSERFGKSVRVETEIGMVAHTANAKAEANRAERQREAEQTVQNDPFVQVMMREFGASIVPGSVRPL